MKILVVSATAFEIQPTIDFFQDNKEKISVALDFVVTGIGQVATTFNLMKALQGADYQMVINIGVAGAYDSALNLGDVVNVVIEEFGDLGAEENDGSFINFYQNGLIPANDFPFMDGKMYNVFASEFDFLPQVKGLTVNKVHGFLPSIERTKQHFQADVETMEGAAVFYTCLQSNVNFLQIRAISNYVEPRNRNNWQMPLAIENLNKVLIEMLCSF
jgi:futalosine hydrolase